MPELYNTQLAANYNKVQTSTNLGGRQLQFYVLYAYEDFYAGDPELSYNPPGSRGYDLLWSEPGSRYEQAVRGIQENAELFFLGEPKPTGSEGTGTEESFVFAVAIDTSVPYEMADTATIARGLVDSLGHDAFSIVPMVAIGDTIQTP
jgi:hypothetical protein